MKISNQVNSILCSIISGSSVGNPAACLVRIGKAIMFLTFLPNPCNCPLYFATHKITINIITIANTAITDPQNNNKNPILFSSNQ